jgi:hypothetical protein
MEFLMNDIKKMLGGNAQEKIARIAADKAQDTELYPGLAQMEREAEEREPTDQELFDANPFPEAIDVDPEEGDDVEIVNGPTPLEPPKRYGPFEVTEVRDAKDNALARPQKSIRATLHVGTKRIPFLVSCFDSKVHALDGVEIGATYNFRGLVKRKITRVNGEKRVSYYLNIV